MSRRKRNFWYYLGQTALGIASIAVTFSSTILDKSFPEHTWVNQMAIPLGVTIKFLWDRILYRRDELPGKLNSRYMDAIPDAFTGIKGSSK